MKKFIVILILHCSIFLYSQNKVIQVEYEVFFNTDKPNTQFANLYISENNIQSIYKKTPRAKASSKIEKKEDNNFDYQFSSNNTNYNYFDIKKDSLFSVETIFNEKYFIKEKIPVLKWELINEEKNIDNIKVSKAICEFRGRKYIAWYSMEYPVKFGPWKLHGLPGLIFEVYDESKRYNWILKKITYEEYSKDIFKVEVTDVKIISINEYPYIKYNNKLMEEKLMSKLPRGTEVINSESPRNGLEIKFEWE
jgi:GLPGLI family protein